MACRIAQTVFSECIELIALDQLPAVLASLRFRGFM